MDKNSPATPDNGLANMSPDTMNNDLEGMTYAQLLALLDGGNAVRMDELDDTVVFDKTDLVGRAFVITNWRHNPEGNMGEFVVCKITVQDGTHGLFTDGSTGIKDQLLKFNEGRPIIVPKGLRKSDYMYKDDFGNMIPATTFYLSNET